MAGYFHECMVYGRINCRSNSAVFDQSGAGLGGYSARGYCVHFDRGRIGKRSLGYDRHEYPFAPGYYSYFGGKRFIHRRLADADPVPESAGRAFGIGNYGRSQPGGSCSNACRRYYYQYVRNPAAKQSWELDDRHRGQHRLFIGVAFDPCRFHPDQRQCNPFNYRVDDCKHDHCAGQHLAIFQQAGADPGLPDMDIRQPGRRHHEPDLDTPGCDKYRDDNCFFVFQIPEWPAARRKLCPEYGALRSEIQDLDYHQHKLAGRKHHGILRAYRLCGCGRSASYAVAVGNK